MLADENNLCVDFDLSYSQEGIWFVSSLGELANAAYNVAFGFELSKSLNMDALIKALSVMLEKHENLRANYYSTEVGPRQIIRENYTDLIEDKVIDIVTSSKKIQDIVNVECEKHFDLLDDSLVRVVVIKDDNDYSGLIFIFHHLVFDEYSARIFFSELGLIYRGLVLDVTPDVCPATQSYSDYIKYERECWSSEGVNYWMSMLDGMPMKLDMPIYKKYSMPRTYQGGNVTLIIEKDIFANVVDKSVNERVSIFLVMLVAYIIFLKKYLSASDFGVCIPVSNRGMGEFDNTIGYFINTIVVRSLLRENESFVDVLHRINLQFLTSLDYANVPFPKLIKELQSINGHRVESLFQFVFNYISDGDIELDFGDHKSLLSSSTSLQAKNDLSLNIIEKGNSLECVFIYNSDVLSSECVESMALEFQSMLRTFVKVGDNNINNKPGMAQLDKRKAKINSEDGNLEYIDCMDGQSSLYDFCARVNDVEIALVNHSDIDGAIVDARENEYGNKYLVAYYVSTKNRDTLTHEHLCSYLQGSLQRHMIPSKFILLDFMPNTHNGKISRKQLYMSISAPLSGSDMGDIFPHATTVEVIRNIWIELLDVENIGIYDDFFALGGHSLLMAKLVSKMQSVFGVRLPLSDIFDQPTISHTAEIIDSIAVNTDVINHVGERVVEIKDSGTYNVSIAQEARLHSDFYEGEYKSHSYINNVRVAYHLSGKLNVEVWKASLVELQSRHDMLRSKYRKLNDHFVYEIESQKYAKVEGIDLTHIPYLSRKDEAINIINKKARSRFDGIDKPAIKLYLIKIGEEEYISLMLFDHLIVDGLSLSIIVDELSIIYNAFVNKKNPKLSESDLKYSDFVVWQERLLEDAQGKKMLQHWKDRLSTSSPLPLLELPEIVIDTQISFKRETQRMNVSTEVIENIKQLSKNRGVTVFMMLLAALGVLIHVYSGRRNIGVLSPGLNRTMNGADQIVGWFANILVIQLDVNADILVSDFLDSVKETVLFSYSNQDIPHVKLIEELEPTHYGKPLSVPTVFFSMITEFKKTPILDGLDVNFVDIDVEEGAPGLDVFCIMHDDNCVVEFSYEKSRYDYNVMFEMLNCYCKLLGQISASSDTKVCELVEKLNIT